MLGLYNHRNYKGVRAQVPATTAAVSALKLKPLNHLQRRLNPRPCTFLCAAQVRAIVSADKAVVFKSHSERENQNLIAPMLQVG